MTALADPCKCVLRTSAAHAGRSAMDRITESIVPVIKRSTSNREPGINNFINPCREPDEYT